MGKKIDILGNLSLLIMFVGLGVGALDSYYFNEAYRYLIEYFVLVGLLGFGLSITLTILFRNKL